MTEQEQRELEFLRALYFSELNKNNEVADFIDRSLPEDDAKRMKYEAYAELLAESAEDEDGKFAKMIDEFREAKAASEAYHTARAEAVS